MKPPFCFGGFVLVVESFNFQWEFLFDLLFWILLHTVHVSFLTCIVNSFNTCMKNKNTICCV